MTLKIVVAAPMPSARFRMASSVKEGRFARPRKLYRRSWMISCIRPYFQPKTGVSPTGTCSDVETTRIVCLSRRSARPPYIEREGGPAFHRARSLVRFWVSRDVRGDIHAGTNDAGRILRARASVQE